MSGIKIIVNFPYIYRGEVYENKPHGNGELYLYTHNDIYNIFYNSNEINGVPLLIDCLCNFNTIIYKLTLIKKGTWNNGIILV